MRRKKADWPITYCDECKHLEYSPIRDAICGKTYKYLWLNGYRMVNGKTWPSSRSPYRYMPKWCPLEKW